ncbi:MULTISPECIES: helix-turn-helix domain-containing protein [unclassified Streptomyces]|uniref:helix-turn-helix domain-containing protein n=1 Tax=unclassified Streptomyces TaxID=2593676 RepID=UPI00380915F0
MAGVADPQVCTVGNSRRKSTSTSPAARRRTAQGIDTATVEGRAMFGMLSVLAGLQRELIVANTNDGLASARARGRVGGRRPKLTEEQATLAQQLYDAGEKTVQQIADLFGVPRSTVYGHLDKVKTVPRQPKKTAVMKS